MEKRAQQLLQEMKAQEAHYSEQLKLTQAAIQILQLLLASPDEGNDVPDDKTDQ
jgi:hypothetical protein